MTMKRMALVGCLSILSATPVLADDVKGEVTKIITAYEACYTKQDAACVAALFSKDGVFVGSAGKTDPLSNYTKTFKTGFNKLDSKLIETWQIDNDTPAAVGTFHISGKSDKGDALDAQGVWSAVYVKEGNGLKIKMLTAAVKPPTQ
jgi:ketosteroid isomerase-like protein